MEFSEKDRQSLSANVAFFQEDGTSLFHHIEDVARLVLRYWFDQKELYVGRDAVRPRPFNSTLVRGIGFYSVVVLSYFFSL